MKEYLEELKAHAKKFKKSSEVSSSFSFPTLNASLSIKYAAVPSYFSTTSTFFNKKYILDLRNLIFYNNPS